MDVTSQIAEVQILEILTDDDPLTKLMTKQWTNKNNMSTNILF